MQATLNQLIKLQKIDSRLLEIEEIKGDLPEKVDQKKALVQQLTSEIVTSTERISEIEKEVRELTTRADDSESKLKKYKEQLYLVSSNKEYDALMSEIDQMKEFLNGVETQILELEEEKSQLEEKIKSDELNIVTSQEELEMNELELEDAMSNSKSEEEDLGSRRAGIVKQIEENYINNYEKLRTAREGIAVATISRNACGVCYNHLPPQLVIEVKQNDSLKLCPSCSVFLYWESEE